MAPVYVDAVEHLPPFRVILGALYVLTLVGSAIYLLVRSFK
jgi:hypothetical protein